MVFWGAEVKPGEPFTHSGEDSGDYEGSRLHLSQATLGLDGKGNERTVVKCKVGDGPELLLCSLTPGVSESCSLDLLFDQDVVFSVIGSTSVHLVGYYMPLDDDGDDDDEDYFEDSDCCDSDEDDEDYEDSDLDVPGASGVKIEEIIDEGTPTPLQLLAMKDTEETPVKLGKKAAKRARAAAAKLAAGTPLSPAENANGSAAKADVKVAEEQSEDEDGFPIPAKKKQAVNGSDGAPVPAQESGKKKRKGKKDKTATEGEAVEKTLNVEAAENVTVEATPTKTPAGNGSVLSKTPAKTPSGNGSLSTPGNDEKTKSAKKSKSPSRTYPNGLIVEEVAMGKPDGVQAKAGKRVVVTYTGKLKSNGKIFDSNVGKKPFTFRLGVGEVIKGWDVGVAGMRVGDKRKITVPPAMAYGAKGVSGIPGNSWLVFDVQVVEVK